MPADPLDGLVVREPSGDGIPVLRDHGGPGVDLVSFVRRLDG
jgi:hypothetical protein